MTGNSCPECGGPRSADGGAGSGCDCARRAVEAMRAERQARAAAAEDFDPLRIRPYVALPEPDFIDTAPPPPLPGEAPRPQAVRPAYGAAPGAIAPGVVRAGPVPPAAGAAGTVGPAASGAVARGFAPGPAGHAAPDPAGAGIVGPAHPGAGAVVIRGEAWPAGPVGPAGGVGHGPEGPGTAGPRLAPGGSGARNAPVPQAGPGPMPDLASPPPAPPGVVRAPGEPDAAWGDDTHELPPLDGRAADAAPPAESAPRRRTAVAVVVGAAVLAVAGTMAFAGGLFSGEREGDHVSMPDRGTSGPSLNVGPDAPSAPASVSGSPSASSPASASSSASASASASGRPSAGASADGTAPAGSAPGATAPSAPPSTAVATGSMSEDSPRRSSAKTLQKGDSGPAVTELQLRLAEIRLYEGPVDGQYGESVEDAVARYQWARGIKSDPLGVYGQKTRRSLEAETSEP
ncbi:peptidoglycan-binding protein [Streptomyces sp. NPDC049597]|uniref:peptidoglycan-binding protein n=1 Tax=Streptomyces sp. NPDC049597 TaxID=3155276 RepID=UPI00341B4BAE